MSEHSFPEYGSFQNENHSTFPQPDLKPEHPDVPWTPGGIWPDRKNKAGGGNDPIYAPEDRDDWPAFPEPERTWPPIDLRNYLDFPRVRDQKKTQCCSAFSLAGLLETWQLNDLGRKIELATGWMHSCIGGKPLKNPVHFDTLGKALAGRKIPKITPQYPNWWDTNCTRPGFVLAPNIMELEKPYSRNQVRAMITHGQPVATGMDINRDFLDWDSSKPYETQSGHQVGTHAVIILGFDNDYWICRNSYGTDWGGAGKGYFRVPIGSCHMCDDVYRVFSVTIRGRELHTGSEIFV